MKISFGALDNVQAINTEFHKFSRGNFELAKMGARVAMHTNGGYRLELSVLEARDLVANLASAFKKPAWRTLVTRYRELMGDI